GPGTAWPPIRPTRSRGPPAPRRSVPPGCGVLPRPADPPVSLASSLPESSVTFALQRTTLYGPNVTLDRMSGLRSPLRRRRARHRHRATADPPHPAAGSSRDPPISLAAPAASRTSTHPAPRLPSALQSTTLSGPNVTLDRMSGLTAGFST